MDEQSEEQCREDSRSLRENMRYQERNKQHKVPLVFLTYQSVRPAPSISFAQAGENNPWGQRAVLVDRPGHF